MPTLLEAANRLECIRVHWGARLPCTESIDGRELCSSCKVRVMVEETERAVRTAVAEIRIEARKTKTIYGGSDFDPVDYKVLTGSPGTLIRVADTLEKAVTGPRL